MKTVEVEYTYLTTNEQQLDIVLAKLERDIGGKRKPYFLRGGAIDLVTILDIVVGFVGGVTVRPAVQKYLEGFLGTDALKPLGEGHRRELNNWFAEVEQDVAKVTSSVHAGLQPLQAPITFNNKSEAVGIQIQLKTGILHVVLNHKGISPQLLNNLPSGVVAAIKYLSESNSISGSNFQLYFDRRSQTWKYLLAPTFQDYRRWIDRYIDLDKGEVVYISSQHQFREIFEPPVEDEHKFLLSPFRDEERE